MKREQISLPLKIVKVLLKELTQATFDAKMTAQIFGQGKDDSDDEWTDEWDDDEAPGKENRIRGYSLTHDKIKRWFKEIAADDSGFASLRARLTPQENAILQDALSLPEIRLPFKLRVR